VEVQSVRHAVVGPGLGYVRITHFSETTARDVAAAVADLQRRSEGPLAGLLLDLRNNPGGVLEAGVEVADAFLDEGVIVSASGRARDARFRMEAHPGDIARNARIAVLINGGSASASEIVAGALRDHGRATLIGRTTFGKGSVQTILPLSGGQAIKLTTSRYFSPSGVSIHERGIEPDILLPRDAENPARTATATLPDLDAEVAVALEWLQQGLSAQRVAGQPSTATAR
jgi:carboxyl-terminal processing protease